jgi:hypothetical protein
MKKALERYATLAEDLAVSTDATGLRYQTTLTADVVDLPRKTGGILQVNRSDGNTDLGAWSSTTLFVPVTPIEGEQMYGAEGALPGTVIGYAFSGPRTIWFWNMSTAQKNAGVWVRYIKQFKGYTDSENVLLPYGQDERIIELTRQFLGAIPPKDLINNEADTRVNG